jgi:hypothetical protein
MARFIAPIYNWWNPFVRLTEPVACGITSIIRHPLEQFPVVTPERCACAAATVIATPGDARQETIQDARRL